MLFNNIDFILGLLEFNSFVSITEKFSFFFSNTSIGMLTLNVVPTITLLSTVIVPLRISTNFFVILSPSPAPDECLLICPKLSKI